MGVDPTSDDIIRLSAEVLRARGQIAKIIATGMK
jgi:hypothetical protein